eukprot:scaffold158209_cov51-Prasinocladus_malaysianus.AAC.1
MVGALSHDLSHPGVNNHYLATVDHPLVKEYGKISTLENMHYSRFLQLLETPANDFTSALPDEQRQRFLDLVKSLILATDMAKHAQHMDSDPPTDPYELMVFKLVMAIKCSDFSHCMRNFRMHHIFTDMLKQEFYSQGDLERGLDLKVSPGMDRGEVYASLAQSQVWFLENFIQPFLDRWAELSGSSTVEGFQALLSRNINSWKMLSFEDAKLKYTDSSVPVRLLSKRIKAKTVAEMSAGELRMAKVLARAHEFADR